MPKDMDCLRDIWHSIDKDTAIAQPSYFTQEARGHSFREYASSIERKCKRACEEGAQWLKDHPHTELPAKKRHFLRGLDIHTGKPSNGPGGRRM